jgi:hypothetical protein
VDDALLVSRRETLRDLDGALDGPRGGEAHQAEVLAQRLPLEELEDDVRGLLVTAGVEDGHEAWVVEGAHCPGFLLEASEAVRV